VRALVLLGLAACGRVGFDADHTDGGIAADASDTAMLAPLHEYPLHDDYADLFGGPDLVPQGGSFVGSRYQFAPNQGLRADAVVPRDVYTIDMMLSFDELDGWNKIVDFEDLGPDTGLYTYKTGVQYVIIPMVDFLTSQPRFTPSSPRRLTATRDASGTAAVYVDGVIALGARGGSPDPPMTPTTTPVTFDDTMNIAAFSSDRAWFFMDDTATNDEAGAGTVERIRIWDIALTAEQVAEAR
jgi:hypothetical protein